MTMLNKKLWVSLPILVVATLVLSAAVGGIEWAFVSLGAMVLIGMISISIHVLAKALRRADISRITEEDKRIIMEHVGELFARDWEQSREMPTEVRPISEKDKKLIMEYVDEFFAEGLWQSEGKPF